MKRLLLLVIGLLATFMIMAQSDEPCETCLPDGIEFTTQAQIDSFQINYSNCTEIEGDVTIGGDDITNLSGLSVLTSIQGNLNIGIQYVVFNPNLYSLSGLNNLTSVGGLHIFSPYSLTNLDGLEGLEIINGDLQIYCWELTSIEALGNIDSIMGWIVIWGSQLVNLNGLEQLKKVYGSFSIQENIYLTSLDGIDSLTYIGGALLLGAEMTMGNALTDISSLGNVNYIGGSVRIMGAPLPSLHGLENLTEINGNLHLASLHPLSNLNGLNNVSSILGSLEIWQNENLINLSGLDNLVSVGVDIDLSENEALVNLSGLENLKTVGGDVSILGYCLYFNDLSALSNLTSINGVLSLDGLISLNSLNGIKNIDASTITDLTIRYNDSLSDCDVLSICNYLNNPSGYIEIYNNSIGCNSPEEVQDSCEANAVSIKERYILDDYSISPNPFTTSTTLSFRLSKPENVRFTVYNVQSQIVYEIEERRNAGEQQIEWNAKGLPSGMYYFRIQAGEKVGGGKMVIGGW
jgi:hypothetical protein